METLVMTQVAPGIGQHSYHHHRHMMVGDNPHREDESNNESSSPSSRNDSEHVASSATPTPSGVTDPSSHTATASRTPTASSPSHVRPDTASTPQPEQPSLNNHSRGFDQNGFPLSNDPRVLQSSPSSPRLQPTYRSTRSLGGSEASSPSRIKVRDLSHIQSFASEEYLARPRLGNRTGSFSSTQYEISSMPVSDIIEMVAGLLTKITTTNDRQHEHLHRPIPTPQDQSNLDSHASCVLAFHGKNVPSITILSYLSRIHKYCPTTYEVFLSLLVYFDRMTDNFNKKFMQDSEQKASATSTDEKAEGEAEESVKSPMDVDTPGKSDPTDLSQFFVVDSYNIHRLVIAGVTCASKFFSDVFYTNSRYAKVGGLPLVELNNLELHFLLLNDFRLSIAVEELEAYGTMLVEFYAREIVAQQQAAQTQHERMAAQGRDNNEDGMYMR